MWKEKVKRNDVKRISGLFSYDWFCTSIFFSLQVFWFCLDDKIWLFVSALLESINIYSLSYKISFSWSFNAWYELEIRKIFWWNDYQPRRYTNVISKLNILITHKRTQAKNTSVLGYRKTNLTSKWWSTLFILLFCYRNKINL